MFQFIEFLAFYVFLPLMILAVIIFDFNLIRRAPGIALKIRSLGGLIGVSIAVIVIFLDLDLGGLIHLPPVNPIKALDLWLSLISTFVIGFLFLLIVDFLIRRGVVPFVIMFTAASSIISPYYLISLSQVRELSSLGIIGFATGWITYFSFSSLRYPTYSFATDSEPAKIKKREQRVSDQLSEIQAKKIELAQRMNRTQIEILESKINMLDQAFEIISKEYSSKLTQDFPKHLEELKESAKTLPANELSAKINDFIGGMNPSLEALPETLGELRTQLLKAANDLESQTRLLLPTADKLEGENVQISEQELKKILFAIGKKHFKITVAHPKLLAKRFASPFLIQVYFEELESEVKAKTKVIIGEDIGEHIYETKLKLGQIVLIKLYSPDIVFPEPIAKKLSSSLNSLTFLGKPLDTCQPGEHKVVLSIQDMKTGIEYQSETFSVKVVDFAFDHISRPLLSRVSTVILGIGSLVMFVLTLLEQIDKTVGLTSGTAAGVLAVAVYAGFYNLYQRVRPSTP